MAIASSNSMASSSVTSSVSVWMPIDSVTVGVATVAIVVPSSRHVYVVIVPSESDEAPFRDELLGAQRLEDRALTLAERFTINPRARATNILPRFAENARVQLGDTSTLGDPAVVESLVRHRRDA